MPEIDALLDRQRQLARILNGGADAEADTDRVNVTSPADEDAGAGADRDMPASREAPRDSAGLADELLALLPERPAAQADGERSVAVAGNNSGIISTGDGAKNALHQ
ncbi:hypothetical protein ACFYW6_04615 [Streptomyces sp. NPDC002659]|uniref:hypothetical protein n=1 Tax=Streptomyces sp. NPDC002659 TaxID=3364656 RepID=UPI0036972420